MIKTFFNILTISAFCTVSAASIGEALNSIADQPDFFRPFATILGTATNAGWYQSASVEKKFDFNISLPISITYLALKDVQYTSTYVNQGHPDQEYTAPTVFGTIRTPVVYKYLRSPGGDIPIALNFTDGVEPLNTLKLIPFIAPQVGFSLFYTELKARITPLPLKPIGLSVLFTGLGLQHDFQYLFPERFPISLSLAFNMTLISATWDVSKLGEENISGTISLSGTTNFVGVVTGYKIGKLLEIFLETGWEHSILKFSGEMTTITNQVPEVNNLNTKLTGRNSFRAALNVAFALGPYRPVIGGIAGAELGNNVNIISFKHINKAD